MSGVEVNQLESLLLVQSQESKKLAGLQAEGLSSHFSSRSPTRWCPCCCRVQSNQEEIEEVVDLLARAIQKLGQQWGCGRSHDLVTPLPVASKRFQFENSNFLKIFVNSNGQWLFVVNDLLITCYSVHSYRF